MFGNINERKLCAHLTAVKTDHFKCTVFWTVTPFSLIEVDFIQKAKFYRTLRRHVPEANTLS
jgi:hypothetical protein